MNLYCKHSVNVNMTEAARRSLERYSYPGNIRELEHLVEFLILNSEKEKYSFLIFLPMFWTIMTLRA